MAVCGVMMMLTGCASSGTANAAPRTTTTTARGIVLWSAPRTGESIVAADVPVFSRYEASARQWTDAGRACRAYDARHGTTSRLSARWADYDYQTTVVADTPCLDHTPMTTKWRITKRAPDPLVPIAAADVPNRRSREARMREWLDGGRTCRAYDRAHGTSTVVVFVPTSVSDGEALVADTPCLGPPPDPPSP